MTFKPNWCIFVQRTGAIALIVVALMAIVGSAGWAQSPASPDQLIQQAKTDLARGDGVAAEFRLKDALAAGASRSSVAAAMGQAQFLQGRNPDARHWLQDGQFAPADALRVFTTLARLEQAEGRLAEAGAALDKALKLAPNDAALWVEVGRLRYMGGEQFLALDAAEKALMLDGRSVRALEFKAQLVRDSQGLEASVPWFERALQADPQDFNVLAEYAAVLGDLGRAKDMLRVCKKLLQLAPNHPRPYYFLATLAARGGNYSVARSLLNKAGDKLNGSPGFLLLDGIIHLHNGNYQLARDSLQRLLQMQPANLRAHRLMAYALYLSKDDTTLVDAYGASAEKPYASPWLQRLLASANERLGHKALATTLRQYADNPKRPSLVTVQQGSIVGDRIASGRIAEAQGMVRASLAANPGFAAFHAMAGDVALASLNPAAALAHYRKAGQVRTTQVMRAKMTLAERTMKAL